MEQGLSGSDISKTQMDLIDLSTNDQSQAIPDDDSLHPIGLAIGPKGFCVKDYEDRMNLLQKENFNLKLRIYFLEEKNPNVPEGAEAIYKQNIDLKVQNEELSKDIQERSDLLCKASKALELLESQKSAELDHAEMMIEEMNQKIESLQLEVASLQNALIDANKSSLANDTGYADFLGAVDSKDVEHQRNLKERNELNEKLQRELDDMKQNINELKNEKKDIESKISALLYENNEMKDKLTGVEKIMSEQLQKFKFLKEFCVQKFVDQEFAQAQNERVLKNNNTLNEEFEELQFSFSESSNRDPNDELFSKLEKELRDFKEKWASTQCDLQDTEDKLKETEGERQKTLTVLQKTLEALESERVKVYSLQHKEHSDGANASRKDHAKTGSAAVDDHVLLIKNKEISDLTDELNKAKQRIEELSFKEPDHNNPEVEKLTNLLGSMQLGRNSIASNLSRISLEQLSSSFNDLKFQQATEEKKTTQLKIDKLMNEIADVANSKTKEHVAQLQKQIKIFNQKQEVTDKAFETSVEVCAKSLELLQGLAQFLKALIQQKEIRESLSEMTMFNIQSTLNKTFDFSNQAARFSIDGRLSCFADISSLDVLMTTTRNSLLNIREIQHSNKSIQASNDECSAALQAEVENAQKELEEFKRVNQVLEDEICHLKESMTDFKHKLADRDEEFVVIQREKDVIDTKLQESQKKIESMYVKRNDLEKKLQAETVNKFELEQRVDKSEEIAANLKQKLNEIQEDLDQNWVTKAQHVEVVKRLEGEIVNGEAQIAAVRLQMDQHINEFTLNEAEALEPMTSALLNDAYEETKENIVDPTTRRTLEISDDRKRLLESNADFAVSSSTDPSCEMCPKHQVKISELKKYLRHAIEKIKFQSKVKTMNERLIKQQINTTETFLHQACSDMAIVLKNRNSKQD